MNYWSSKLQVVVNVTLPRFNSWGLMIFSLSKTSQETWAWVWQITFEDRNYFTRDPKSPRWFELAILICLGVSTPLKNISQDYTIFPTNEKQKMEQITNQFCILVSDHQKHPRSQSFRKISRSKSLTIVLPTKWRPTIPGMRASPSEDGVAEDQLGFALHTCPKKHSIW